MPVHIPELVFIQYVSRFWCAGGCGLGQRAWQPIVSEDLVDICRVVILPQNEV